MTVKLGLFTMPFHHMPRLSQHAAASAPPGSGAAAGRARRKAR